MSYSNYLIVFILVIIKITDSKVLIYDNATRLSNMYKDAPADFGKDVPQRGFVGYLHMAKPMNACLSLNKIKKENSFLLVEESNSQTTCSYEQQAHNAQFAGYSAVIIYRKHNNDDLATMEGEGPAIVAVMVTREAGDSLKNALYNTGSIIKITAEIDLPFQLYLIPFVVVISICFAFMLLFSLGRYCRFRLRQRRSRLSPANLKKIPTKKFAKGDDYDICAICIEEYEENEKIRILPCNHAYHTKCVDPWLTSGKKVCPVCKQSVDIKKMKKKRKQKRAQRQQNFDQASTSSRNLSDEDATSVDEADDIRSSNERTPLLSSTDNARPSGAIDV